MLMINSICLGNFEWIRKFETIFINIHGAYRPPNGDDFTVFDALTSDSMERQAIKRAAKFYTNFINYG